MKNDISIKELKELDEQLTKINFHKESENPCEEISLPKIKEKEIEDEFEKEVLFEEAYPEMSEVEPTISKEDVEKQTRESIKNYLDNLSVNNLVSYNKVAVAPAVEYTYSYSYAGNTIENCDCLACQASRRPFKVAAKIPNGHPLTKMFKKD